MKLLKSYKLVFSILCSALGFLCNTAYGTAFNCPTGQQYQKFWKEYTTNPNAGLRYKTYGIIIVNHNPPAPKNLTFAGALVGVDSHASPVSPGYYNALICFYGEMSPEYYIENYSPLAGPVVKLNDPLKWSDFNDETNSKFCIGNTPTDCAMETG